MFGLIAKLGFGLVDAINNKLDPYDDFTRPFLPPPNNLSLLEKAIKFQAQLLTDFRLPTGLFQYDRTDSWDTPDFGDQAVHHGLATAALAFGRLPMNLADVEVSLAVKATNFLFQNNKLVRGRDPRDPSKYADDASNDSATGVLCGLFFGARYGGGGAGVEAISVINLLASELADNNYSLVRQDGTPTTYGKLINGILTAPQLASLALAIFRAAHVMTGNAKYGEHFDRLYRKYGCLLEFTEFKFLDYTKSHEVHRCAIHLHILAELAQDNRELSERCANGLRRIWQLNRKTRDPWIAALVNQWWRIPDSEMIDVVRRLHEYPVDGKPPIVETINSAKTDYWKERGVRFIKVGDNIRSTQPLPYHTLPTQDFWPQRHPFMCDGNKGDHWTLVKHNAVDFLAPYYLLRRQHVIREDA